MDVEELLRLGNAIMNVEECYVWVMQYARVDIGCNHIWNVE
jgi:hypothetical protein